MALAGNEIRELFQKADEDIKKINEICDSQIYGFENEKEGNDLFNPSVLDKLSTLQRQSSRADIAVIYYLSKGHTMEELMSDAPDAVQKKKEVGQELRKLLEGKSAADPERDAKLIKLAADLYQRAPELLPISGDLGNDRVLAENYVNIHFRQCQMDLRQMLTGTDRDGKKLNERVEDELGEKVFEVLKNKQFHYSYMRTVADQRKRFLTGDSRTEISDDEVIRQATAKAILSYYNGRAEADPLLTIEETRGEVRLEAIKRQIAAMQEADGAKKALREYVSNPEAESTMINLRSVPDWEKPGEQRLMPFFTEEFMELAHRENAPFHRFYTPIEGMEGVGTPLVPAASVSTAEERPEQVKGGTYSGMQVTQKVMEAIKEGNGGSIFYFEENPERPGYYIMHPTYPESGIGERGETYKLRENINLLYKGIASKFVDGRGEVDIRGGRRFMDEFSRRFQSEKSNNPILSRQEVVAERMEWLCHELRIPTGSQEDFTRFFQSCVVNSRPTSDYFVYNKLFDLMESWTDSALMTEAAIERNAEDDQLLLDAIRPGFEQSKQEILELAAINPVTERRMIVPTECSGSADANVQIFNRAFRGQEGFGRYGKFGYSIAGEYDDMIERRNKLRDELNQMQENPEKEAMALFNAHHQDVAKRWAEEEDPEKKAQLLAELQEMISDPEKEGMRLFNQRLAQLAEPLADLQNEIDAKSIEDPDMELKWDFHYATNAASFEMEQPDGTKKTYYISLEAFAPESNVMMDHPAMTMDVSIGIYESEEDFRAYYRQDNAMVRRDDSVTQKVINFKQNEAKVLQAHLKNEENSLPENSLTEEVRQQLNKTKKDLIENRKLAYAKEWEKEIVTGVAGRKREFEIGVNIDGGDLDAQKFNRTEQMARAFTSRIPVEVRERYESLVEAFGHLNYQASDLIMQEMAYIDVWNTYKDKLDNRNLSSQERQETETIVNALEDLSERASEENMPVQVARAGAGMTLTGIVQGAVAEIHSEEWDDINQQLRPYGFTVDSMVEMARTIQNHVLPVTQVQMDVQEAFPGLAEGLMETKDFRSLLRTKSMTVDFAVNNFDAAIRGNFLPKEQENMKAMGMRLYGQILIDGRQASQILSDKYPGYPLTEDLAKCEIVAAACRGEQVEFAHGFSDETRGKVPLKVISRIPKVREAVAAKEAQRTLEEPRARETEIRTQEANAVQSMTFADLMKENGAVGFPRERRASENGKSRSTQKDSVQKDSRQNGRR